MAVERADAAPRLEPCAAAPRAGETVDLAADQMPQRVATEGIARQENHVDRHHDGADADPKLPRPRGHGTIGEHAIHGPPHGEEDVIRENEDEDHRRVHEPAVHVLENEGESGFTVVTVSRLADAAGDGVEEKRPVVCLAIVVARRAESARENENQKCGGEGPPGGLDQRRVERRQVRAPLVVDVDPGCPRRIDGKTAQYEGRKGRSNPPRIASKGRAEGPFLQVVDGRRHRVTAPIVCLTASADLLRALFSSAVSCTSTIFSRPFLPSLQGTPQYIPESPYSPSSHAAHGSSRF